MSWKRLVAINAAGFTGRFRRPDRSNGFLNRRGHPARRHGHLADTLHGPHIYREHGLPIGPSWDDLTRLIEDAASDDPT